MPDIPPRKPVNAATPKSKLWFPFSSFIVVPSSRNKEKKQIISRNDAYHGSTFLGASCSGKERDKNNFDFASNIVHHISSPNPFRKPDDLTDE